MLRSALDSRKALVSAALLAEYARALNSERARRHHLLSSAQLSMFLAQVEIVSRLVAPRPGPGCPDRRDQHLWDILNAVPDSILVTGEAALLSSQEFPGRVLSPREFVERYLSA